MRVQALCPMKAGVGHNVMQLWLTALALTETQNEDMKTLIGVRRPKLVFGFIEEVLNCLRSASVLTVCN